MIDLSDNLRRVPSKSPDVIFENTAQFKIRNILKTSRGENPYDAQFGLDLADFWGGNEKLSRIAAQIGRNLFTQDCEVSSLSLCQKNGKVDVKISTPTGEVL